ncbi:MAG: 2-C-methyl-D-erythritol 4-phosphate cytidylyltransferase [Bacteroidaceae bacterium]|nr:2-C-methyl-D-erythritol 4-phosphate cytidylyltransferase [Bacteroidaceae bacterium]
MDRYAILVAGGKGLRMGSDIPKQFLPLRGRPVLMHTIDVFRRTYPDIHIILVLPREQQDYWRQLCGQHDYDVELCVADGGETRFHSVHNGLSLIPDDARGVVGVHDGVRPFVSPEAISRCFEAAEEFGAVVPVVPVVETVRQVLADGGSMTVDRNAYRLVQTPQTFDIQLLKKAYGQPFDPFFTDDASVVEAMGHPIKLVEGNNENIKLTNPADLKLAEGMV